jgi:hypothetical protein
MSTTTASPSIWPTIHVCWKPHKAANRSLMYLEMENKA